MLAPGSSVVKTDKFTSVIKEPGKRDVNIRNSDLANFGTKAERQTELQVYVYRRPKTLTGKITEDLISHHAKESRKKLEGGGLLDTFKCNSSSSSTNAHQTKTNSYNSAPKATSRINE